MTLQDIEVRAAAIRGATDPEVIESVKLGLVRDFLQHTIVNPTDNGLRAKATKVVETLDIHIDVPDAPEEPSAEPTAASPSPTTSRKRRGRGQTS